MTSVSNVRRLPRFAVTLLIAGGLTALLLTPWVMSVIAPIGTPERCAFNSVTEDGYQQLLAQARAQRWTVWPGLSNGIFWPADQGPRPPMTDWEPEAAPKLLAFIRELVAPEARSADKELAAAHAVMRSIGAELFQVFDVPNSQGPSQILFNYFMPQRRFAPLCLFCLIWPDTAIRIVFDRHAGTGVVALNRVWVLHAGVDYRPRKERNVSGTCPAFPPVRPGR